MATTESYERLAWIDRFNRPTIATLRSGLDAQSARLFDKMRQRLTQLDGVVEDFGWHGVCWRWAVEFHTRLSEEPLALIIPSPEDLQVAMPLDQDFVDDIYRKPMKRSIRDGLDLVQAPFQTRWSSWSIAMPTMVDDLVKLVEHRIQHLSRKAG